MLTEFWWSTPVGEWLHGRQEMNWDNINMDIRQTSCNDEIWMELTHDYVQ
jgi:hypothetical protein